MPHKAELSLPGSGPERFPLALVVMLTVTVGARGWVPAPPLAPTSFPVFLELSATPPNMPSPSCTQPAPWGGFLGLFRVWVANTNSRIFQSFSAAATKASRQTSFRHSGDPGRAL